MTIELKGKDFYVTSCTNLPPVVNSETPWCTTNGMLPKSALPMLEMQICLIFLATFFLHTIVGRLGIPRFTSMSIVSPSLQHIKLLTISILTYFWVFFLPLWCNFFHEIFIMIKKYFHYRYIVPFIMKK